MTRGTVMIITITITTPRTTIPTATPTIPAIITVD